MYFLFTDVKFSGMKCSPPIVELTFKPVFGDDSKLIYTSCHADDEIIDEVCISNHSRMEILDKISELEDILSKMEDRLEDYCVEYDQVIAEKRKLERILHVIFTDNIKMSAASRKKLTEITHDVAKCYSHRGKFISLDI